MRDSLNTPIILDTLSQEYIHLDDITVYPAPDFESKEARHSYYVLKWMVYRVYPFAKTASERLKTINERISTIKRKREKRKYLKRLQKYFEGEFSEKLKSYTIWEGQILVKLIYRQTGMTAYDLVKELRNGFQAFIYNATASFFSISLKREYHPEYVYKDFMIEQILMHAFAKGELIEQPSEIEINYHELLNHWRNTPYGRVVKNFNVKSNKKELTIDN